MAMGVQTMRGQELELLRNLSATTREIESVVAKAYGIDVDDLDPSARRRLEDEVEALIEEHEEALHEGDTVEEWRALDQRLAQTEVGRLLQERHEIAEQILDLRDAAA
jgi:AAA+ superfamily predicted ATPase